MTGEGAPKPSIEEQVLLKLGYGQQLDTPLSIGEPAKGRNFLDAYGNSPQRQHTEDLLNGFLDMPETDPDYEPMKAYLTTYLESQFGPPQGQ
jgi:hypothetical protein